MHFQALENYISLAGARGKIHNKSAQLKNNKDADLSQQGLGVMSTTNTATVLTIKINQEVARGEKTTVEPLKKNYVNGLHRKSRKFNHNNKNWQ